MSSSSESEEIQRALGASYVIERELGRGGMGAVYLARDLALDRPVAIKVLPPELAVRPELRERFLRETRTAASFSHPNIVPVHAVEERGAVLCFVMGFVDGETLAQRIRRAGPLPAAEIVRMMQEVAWALSYAHGRGVIHRDIKPDNILIERATGRALVMDFGIARSATSASAGLTRVGEVVGTPHYMSPEQASGDTVDAPERSLLTRRGRLFRRHRPRAVRRRQHAGDPRDAHDARGTRAGHRATGPAAGADAAPSIACSRRIPPIATPPARHWSRRSTPPASRGPKSRRPSGCFTPRRDSSSGTHSSSCCSRPGSPGARSTMAIALRWPSFSCPASSRCCCRS